MNGHHHRHHKKNEVVKYRSFGSDPQLVADGTLTEERIDESVARILEVKLTM